MRPGLSGWDACTLAAAVSRRQAANIKNCAIVVRTDQTLTSSNGSAE
ncbi:MAG: hypothetical protein LBQ76_05510 [Candidatus Fibromonas sp.]|nr:hypothetical protein [Candidatus Fibromonas sp.]